MKKIKKILTFAIVALFATSSMIFFSACNDKKSVSAPVITQVYQDENGNVYVKHNGIKNSTSPEFSLNGTDWFSVASFDGGTSDLQILSCSEEYGETKGTGRYKFYCSSDSTKTTDACEITVRLRESETATTKPSPASNTITYKLLEPQHSEAFSFLENCSLNEQQPFDGTVSEFVEQRYIAKINNDYKIVKDVLYGSFTKYAVDVDGCFEFCCLTTEDKNSYQYSIDSEYVSKNYTFKQITNDGIVDLSSYLNDSYLYEENETDQYLFLVLRRKAVEGKLASPCFCVEVKVTEQKQ